MSKPRGFDLLPQTPAIVALRAYAEARTIADAEAAARDYVAAMTEQTGDPLAGVHDLVRVVGAAINLTRPKLTEAVQ